MCFLVYNITVEQNKEITKKPILSGSLAVGLVILAMNLIPGKHSNSSKKETIPTTKISYPNNNKEPGISNWNNNITPYQLGQAYIEILAKGGQILTTKKSVQVPGTVSGFDQGHPIEFKDPINNQTYFAFQRQTPLKIQLDKANTKILDPNLIVIKGYNTPTIDTYVNKAGSIIQANQNTKNVGYVTPVNNKTVK
jgi:hypothetical protein